MNRAQSTYRLARQAVEVIPVNPNAAPDVLFRRFLGEQDVGGQEATAARPTFSSPAL
ncbi:hypothetical protein [Streptomyces sp. NPDC057302]|uniref:hypothetical protein n=1 Tax=Streptomyces sp. NPDC057302 TaxID=3346094 RepID=UPI003628FCF1